MQILNDDCPYVSWIHSDSQFSHLVPEEAVDLCPECAQKIVVKIRKQTGAKKHELFVDGGDASFGSNESDYEHICEECGQPLYTELLEPEDFAPNQSLERTPKTALLS
jgi:DNA-directed RNA polymerase subunit RPC12/RpoP